MSSLNVIFAFFLFQYDRWRCVPEDRQILQDINKELNYTLQSWTEDNDCCQYWYGVGCDSDTSRVNAIAIQYTPISLIPPSLARVPYLKQLFIRKAPTLTGEIPEFLSNLTSLTMLDISWTNITGPIPLWFHRLHNLQYLRLSYNRLTGTIPPYLADMPSLTFLDLGRNQLTGAQLQRNRLTGDPSHLFNNRSKSLWQLDLSRNLFAFDLTAVQIPVETLYRFDISHNMIGGSIPKELVNASSLGIFNVSYNRLCGKIPYEGRLLQFDNTTFFHNRCLCGLPLCVSC
ncbi:unnamed protein product [Victoria cruziana]